LRPLVFLVLPVLRDVFDFAFREGADFVLVLVFVFVFALRAAVVVVFLLPADLRAGAVFDFVFVAERLELALALDFVEVFVFAFVFDLAFAFDEDFAFAFDFTFELAFDFTFDFAFAFDDERPVGLRPVVDRPLRRSSSSPSSSFEPISFFATPTAAGIATPSAVPATTFCLVDSIWSSSFAMSPPTRLPEATRCYAASLNASMNFGMMRSRRISGPCVATYFPAASAASSAIGSRTSDAASQLVAAAEAMRPDPDRFFDFDVPFEVPLPRA